MGLYLSKPTVTRMAKGPIPSVSHFAEKALSKSPHFVLCLAGQG